MYSIHKSLILKPQSSFGFDTQRAIYFSENMARKSINFDRNANEFFLGINRIITNCFRRESIVTKLYDDVIFL